MPHHICDIDCLGGLYLNYPGHGFQVSMQESGAAYTPVNSSTWGSRTTYQWEAGFPVLSGNCLTWNSADGKVYLRNCNEYPLAQAFSYDGASLINEQDSHQRQRLRPWGGTEPSGPRCLLPRLNRCSTAA